MVNSNVIYEVENEPSWITYIKNRIEDNQNFIGIFTGATGSGKTYSALSVAEQIDPKFDVKRQCIFKFKQALELIRSEWFKKELDWKIIVWDEPQIEMGNRNWQSQMNKFINYLLTTFRHRNVILLFASPYKSFLDSQSMKLVHGEFKCMGWSDKTKLSRVKPRLLQYNDDKQKIYPHKLYVHTIDDGFNAIDTWEVLKASNLIAIEYEKLKTIFTDNLYKEMDEGMSGSVMQKGNRNFIEEQDYFNEIADKHKGNLYLIQKEFPNKSISTLKGLLAVYVEKLRLIDQETATPYVISEGENLNS